MYHIKLFIIVLCLLLVTDMIWLGYFAKSMYLENYAEWLRMRDNQLQPLWWAGGLVYFLLALSLVVFVIPLAGGSLLSALIYGAIMGCITYGVYDFTCLAIFKNFPVGISFIDWAWGTFLCAFCSGITVYLSRFIS